MGGHGQGDYIQGYKYVGCGGDFARPRRDFTCLITTCCLLSLLLIPLLLWLLCGEATSLPYDCALGFAQWETSWSPAQQEFCCSTMGRGCSTALPLPAPTNPPTPFPTPPPSPPPRSRSNCTATAAHHHASSTAHCTGRSLQLRRWLRKLAGRLVSGQEGVVLQSPWQGLSESRWWLCDVLQAIRLQCWFRKLDGGLVRGEEGLVLQ